MPVRLRYTYPWRVAGEPLSYSGRDSVKKPCHGSDCEMKVLLT